MTDFPAPRRLRWSRLRHNPVAIKELRGRVRGRRAFVVLTAFLAVLAFIVLLVYAGFRANTSTAAASRNAGQSVFIAGLAVQGFLVAFIGPALTAGSISGEKERQTYQLLRTTILPARELVLGKLIAALSYLLLLIVSAMPLLSLAFILGGIDWMEFVVSQLMIVATAVAYTLIGIYASSRARSTLSATIFTFAVTFFLLVGLPGLLLTVVPLGSFLFFNAGAPPLWVESVLFIGGIALSVTNLPAAMIISDIVLRQESALFYFRAPTSTGTLWLPSPWYLFILFHILLSWFLYRRAVRRVRRIPTR